MKSGITSVGEVPPLQAHSSPPSVYGWHSNACPGNPGMTPLEKLASNIANLLNAGVWPPSRITCPTERLEQELIVIVADAMCVHGVTVEVVDLRPAPLAGAISKP